MPTPSANVYTAAASARLPVMDFLRHRTYPRGIILAPELQIVFRQNAARRQSQILQEADSRIEEMPLGRHLHKSKTPDVEIQRQQPGNCRSTSEVTRQGDGPDGAV